MVENIEIVENTEHPIVDKQSEVVDKRSEEHEGDEGDDDDVDKLFIIMHTSIDGLENNFNDYYDNPTPEKFKEFEQLLKDFIALTRDLKNISKSLLPRSEQPKKKKAEKHEETLLDSVNVLAISTASQDTTSNKKNVQEPKLKKSKAKQTLPKVPAAPIAQDISAVTVKGKQPKKINKTNTKKQK